MLLCQYSRSKRLIDSTAPNDNGKHVLYCSCHRAVDKETVKKDNTLYSQHFPFIVVFIMYHVFHSSFHSEERR